MLSVVVIDGKLHSVYGSHNEFLDISINYTVRVLEMLEPM